jgi:A/G-specific adenine glycosylase
MEFGALVCLPRRPLCTHCVLAEICKANIQGIAETLPVKKEKSTSRIRFLHYFFIQYNGVTYIKQRKSKDIWNSLFEFPLIETGNSTGLSRLLRHSSWNSLFGGESVRFYGKVRRYKHQLTHQTLHCYFYNIKVKSEPAIKHKGYFPVSLGDLDQYAIPRALDRFLEDLKHEGLL